MRTLKRNIDQATNNVGVYSMSTILHKGRLEILEAAVMKVNQLNITKIREQFWLNFLNFFKLVNFLNFF